MDLTNLLNNIPYSSKNAIVFDIDGTLIDNNKKLNTKTFEFYYYCLYINNGSSFKKKFSQEVSEEV